MTYILTRKDVGVDCRVGKYAKKEQGYTDEQLKVPETQKWFKRQSRKNNIID